MPHEAQPQKDPGRHEVRLGARDRKFREDKQRRADQQERGPDLADFADGQVGVAVEVEERQGEQDGVRDEERRALWCGL